MSENIPYIPVKISEKEPDITLRADRYPVSQSTFSDLPPVVRIVWSTGEITYMNFTTYTILASNFYKFNPILFEVFSVTSLNHYTEESKKRKLILSDPLILRS